MKKLYRSDKNRVFAGIIGGFGEYYEIDPTLLRALTIAVVLITGFCPGVVAYLLMILIIPNKPKEIEYVEKEK
ncbi:MAG: PspC domain-containing protein [Candidatus Paceibacterota bacterium]|jgi:phage shock protein C